MKNELLSFVLFLLVAGCGVPGGGPGAAAGVEAAPLSVEIDGRALRLEVDLWRDFQPVAPPDGQPLMAVARVVAEDGRFLPEDVAVSRVWVLNGREQWAPELSAAAEPMLAHMTDGPKWGPGISVDVVVRLERGGESWLLRAADQPIKRTD